MDIHLFTKRAIFQLATDSWRLSTAPLSTSAMMVVDALKGFLNSDSVVFATRDLSIDTRPHPETTISVTLTNYGANNIEGLEAVKSFAFSHYSIHFQTLRSACVKLEVTESTLPSAIAPGAIQFRITARLREAPVIEQHEKALYIEIKSNVQPVLTLVQVPYSVVFAGRFLATSERVPIRIMAAARDAVWLHEVRVFRDI